MPVGGKERPSSSVPASGTNLLIKQSLKKTSLKGIPRAVSADLTGLSIFWILFVLVCLCISVYTVVNLLTAYMTYGESTEVRTEYESESRAPKITLCDLSWNLKYQAYRSNETIKYPEYMRRISQEAKLQNHYMEYLRLYGYPENIGIDNINKLLESSLKSFIVKCSVWIAHAAQNNPTSCEDYIHIKSYFSSPDIPNCFTISFTDSTVSELSLILHTGNNPELNGEDFYEISNYTSADDLMVYNNGAKIILRDKENPSDINKHGHIFSPGHRYRIHLEVNRYERLSPPYGQCKENHETAYSQDLCVSTCIRDETFTRCNCLVRENIHLHDKNTTKNFCGHLNFENISSSVDNLNCFHLNTQKIQEICQCPVPCIETDFKMDYSFTKWPNDIHKLTLYNMVIRGSPLESLYSDNYNEIQTALRQNSTNVKSLLTNDHILNDNFIYLDFNFDSLKSVTVWRNTRAYTLSQLFSHVGGAVNLFSGITVMIFAEIADLFVCIIYNKCRNI